MTTQLDRDFEALVLVELTREVVRVSTRVVSRYALRAGDVLQLASCIVLSERSEAPVALVAFDDRLSDAARGEGLVIADV